MSKPPQTITISEAISPSKEDLRARIQKDIDQFLSNGGVIKHIPIGVGLDQDNKRKNVSARVHIAMTNHRESKLAMSRKRKKTKIHKDRPMRSFLPKFLR